MPLSISDAAAAIIFFFRCDFRRHAIFLIDFSDAFEAVSSDADY